MMQVALFSAAAIIGFVIGRMSKKTKHVEKKSGRGHRSEKDTENHNDHIKME